MEQYDTRKLRKRILELVKGGNDLTTVKQATLFLLQLKHLPFSLDNYIDYKFIKYCSQKLGNELQLIIPTWDANNLKQVATNVLNAKNVTELPPEVTKLQYFQLIANEPRILVDKYKLEILQRVQIAVSEAIFNLNIGASRNKNKAESLLQLIKEQITLVYCVYGEGNFDFDQVLAEEHEPNCVEWQKFKSNHPDEARTHKTLFEECQNKLKTILGEVERKGPLWDNVKESAKRLVTELHAKDTIEILYQSEKKVIVCKKPMMMLSCVLALIEVLMKRDEQVEEVHLIAAEVIYIDRDLKKEVWHGKNILIVSKKIQFIAPGVVWDVGGSDGKSASSTKALDGDANDMNGKDGSDGKPGESGGYGTLIADKFINLHYLTFKSSGGNGGSGQRGGDGRNGTNGRDGEEMSMDILKRDFKSPAVYFAYRCSRLVDKTTSNLINEISQMKTTGSYGIGRMFSIRQGHYISGSTSTGLQIEFGYSNTLSYYRCSYILVKGAPGTVGQFGGFGGDGGCAGEGGLPGTLTAFHLNGENYIWESSPVYYSENGRSGRHGDDGKDGDRGKCGSNGRDVGYVDSVCWFQPVYYGPGTYKLAEASISDSHSVWCSHFKKWRKLISDRRDPPQPLEQKRTKQRKTKLNVAPQKKNDINSQQVLSKYANYVMNSSYSTQLGSLEFEQTLRDVMALNQIFLKKNKKQVKSKANIGISKPFPSMASKGWSRDGGNRINSSFRCSSDKSSKLIAKLRFQTLKNTGKELSCLWDNCTKQTVDYEKHTTSTKSHCSALHALFGKVNNLGYFEAHSGIRKETCARLRKFSDKGQNAKAVEYLRDCLLTYLQDDSHPLKVRTESTTPNLDELYKKFKANPDNIDWSWLSEDNELVKEYFDILEKPSSPFLTCDLKLVAQVYGMPLEIYVTDTSTPMCIPLDSVKIGDYDQAAAFPVAVNENHEFSRMTAVGRRDMWEIHKTKVNIVKEVYSLSTEEELQKYLLEKKFGTRTPPKMKIEDEQLLEINRNISHSVCDCDERLVVETSLLGWPPILVRVFHDRLIMVEEECGDEQEVIRFTFSKITEYSMRQDAAHKLAELLWIISASCIENWVSEILIIVGEERFKSVSNEDIKEWRKIVIKFPQKLVAAILKLVEAAAFEKEDKVGFQKYLKEIEKFELNEKMDFSKLSTVSKSEWSYQLPRLSISTKLEMLPNVSWNEHDNKFRQALYYLHALYNVKEKQVTELLDTLHQVLSDQETGKNCLEITKILSNFYGGQWTLDDKCVELLRQRGNVQEWMNLMEKECLKLSAGSSRSLQEIQAIVEVDSNSTLTSEEVQSVAAMVESMDGITLPEYFSTNFESAMSQWVTQFQAKIKGKTMNSMGTMDKQLEAVAVVNMVIEKKLGYCLRPTQKFAIIASLYLGANERNLLSQIATGEGKTCIVLAVAIVMSLFGENVDVVTSSGVLAQRDAKSYESIYSAFGLSVGEVTGDDQDERVRAYQCDIVYGECGHFQRDYLLDRFYNQSIRGSRKFSRVIVDEVDSMFLDKGNNVLYLSHQPPDLDCLESIFVFIWSNVVRTVNSGEFHPMSLHELVLSAIYPTLSTEDLLSLLDAGELSSLWDWMVSKKIINGSGRLFFSDMHKIQKLLEGLPANYSQWKNQIVHLINSVLESPGRLSVMNYLKPFVEHHLFSWVKSAAHATQLTEGKEYIVDVDRSKTSLDKDPKIMILDLDTGVDLKESQWNEGLHQFLQLKHGCSLSLMSLKAVFISNISFFNKYERIFGLTGTIGTQSDRNFLKTTYSVELLCVPLALPKMFVELEPQILFDVHTWKQQIFQECKEVAEAGRSALVICKTVQDAEILHAHISSMDAFPTSAIELYRRDYETFQATDQDRPLETRRFLTATNLAGRGTDIKLSQQLRENGGLHVILSYLPDNLRVEQQAFGRASRCGDPGTGRLIALDTISETFEADPINLKLQRDNSEMLRVSEVQCYYSNVIKKEELMFELFRESFEKLTGALDKAYQYVKDHYEDSEEVDETRKMMDGNIKEIRELVMYSLLDDWAFWLDRYSTLLVSKHDPDRLAVIDKGLHQFELDEDVLIQDFQRMTGRYDEVSVMCEDPQRSLNTLLHLPKRLRKIEGYALSLIHEPALLVKVSKCMINRKDYDTALRYLNRVVEEERGHSVVALYYKILCKLKKKQVKCNEFDKMIVSVREMLDEYSIRQSGYCNVGQDVEYVGTKQILRGDGYRKQKENVIKLLCIFRQSIDSMVGSARLLPNDFASICNGHVCEHLCEYLVEKEALLRPQFVFRRDSVKLQILADSFCLSKSKLIRLLKRFDGKYLVPGEEKKLKQKLDLPSRSDFWKQINSCLEDITEFAVIQGTRNDSGENSREEDDFKGGVNGGRVFISKYGSDMKTSTKNQMVIKGLKREFQREQKFIRLRKIGKLCYEQVGWLNPDKLKALKLTKYHKVDSATFSLIPSIGKVEAQKIFRLLQKHRIIDNDGVLLTTEWAKNTLHLTPEFEVYRPDILSILQSKCRYQYELLSLLFQTELAAKAEENQDYIELKISLPSRPCKDFIMTAMEQGFILGMRANPGYFDDSGGAANFFINVFREPAAWGKWVAKQLGGESTKPYLFRNDLKKLFPNESDTKLDELYKQLIARNWINPHGEIILEARKNGKLQQLSPQFEYHQPDVHSLAEWLTNISKENFLKDVLAIVYESLGKLSTLESPDGEMVELEKRLEGYPHKGAELMEQVNMFTLSGFDHVIDVVEEKYTWKMIGSAIAVIIVGLAQIALGVYLEFVSCGFGTYVASGLIQEGISDMIYGVMSFRSGHFSWQDWVDHKWRSIAITCSTMSIGALISRGAKFSKYGLKLFGRPNMSGRVVQETLKESGKAGIKRSIAPILVKSFGYKVLHGCTMAGSSMAASFVYERALKKFIDHVSSTVFNNTSEAIKENSISITVSKLVDRVGVEKAREIADRCRNRVMSDSSCEIDAQQYFSHILTPLMNGLKEAVGKLSRASTFASQDATLVMNLLTAASYAMTGVAVCDALAKMKNSINEHLMRMESEIQTEISLVNWEEIGRVVVSKKEKEDLMHDFNERTNALMREKIGGVMRHTVVEPLMYVGCQKLLVTLGRGVREVYREIKEEDITYKLDKIKFKLESNPDASLERKRALQRKVVQICSKSRDPNVIAHAVEFGGPMGLECVQALANKLGVRIVVDSDNCHIPKEFIPQSGYNFRATLHLKHTVTSDDPNDLGHWEAQTGGNENVGVENSSADCLLDAVNQQLKEHCPSVGKIGRRDLANFIRNDACCQEFIKIGWHHTYNSLGGFGGANYKKFKITDKTKHMMASHITRAKDILSGNGELANASDIFKGENVRPGPIQQIAFETIKGQRVPIYQRGTITAETIANTQPINKEEKNAVKGIDCGAVRGDDAGHISPAIWGAPTTRDNMYPQNSYMNRGANRDIEQIPVDFIRANANYNPCVTYEILLTRDGNHVRPTKHMVLFKLRKVVNGETVEEEQIFIIPNYKCKKLSNMDIFD